MAHSFLLFLFLQLINNAGYFREALEGLDNLDFADQLKTIDICACGPLRVTSALLKGDKLLKDSKVIMITSQGGSVGWRTVQNPEGKDYGHHVRKICFDGDVVPLFLPDKFCLAFSEDVQGGCQHDVRTFSPRGET